MRSYIVHPLSMLHCCSTYALILCISYIVYLERERERERDSLSWSTYKDKEIWEFHNSTNPIRFPTHFLSFV